jgi:hypothetical protein
MPDAASAPRELSFHALSAAVKDAEMLAECGYTKLGEWDLAQACGHCALWLRYPVEGVPPLSLGMRMMLAIIRPLQGKRMLRQILESGKMKPGMPTAPFSVPEPSGADPAADAAAVEELRAAVDQFTHYSGKLHPSPVFGAIGREDMTRLHCIHLAHHLRLLLPKEPSGDV